MPYLLLSNGLPGTRVCRMQPDGLYTEVEIIRFDGGYSMILRVLAITLDIMNSHLVQ